MKGEGATPLRFLAGGAPCETMKKTEEEALVAYMLSKLQWLENDLIYRRNVVRYRDADEVDCLELMIARVRLYAFKEMFREITRILKFFDGKE